MQDPNGHWSANQVQNYSLGLLEDAIASELEEHLLICGQCVAALTAIEPFNFIHYTKDGPFYSRVTRLATGKFFARHWGRRIEGGREFRSSAGAKAYLSRSFEEMFPEHVCTANCGPASSCPKQPPLGPDSGPRISHKPGRPLRKHPL